jgi:outer membrane protein assembly factor BamB
MRGLAKFLLAMAGCLAAAGCGRSNGPISLTHASVLAKAGLARYWDLQLQLPDGETIERLILLEENLYCLTSHNTLIAVDAARGVRKWARRIVEPGVKVHAPCHGDDVALADKPPGVRELVSPAPEASPKAYHVVLVNTPNEVQVLDRASGKLLRRLTFNTKPYEFTANTGGACDGTYYYVGSVAGRCYALRLNDEVVAWVLYTGDILRAAPRCHNPGGSKRVFLAGEDGNYYVAKAGDVLLQVWPMPGQKSWPAMAGQVSAAFHVDDRACFIPCLNNRVYAFSLSGGPALWRFTCGGPLFDDVQVSENTVFQYARGDRLHAINPANGQQRWAMPEGRRVLASIAGEDGPTAYVVGDRKQLLVVDEILGKVRASIPLTGCDLFADNTTAPAMYMTGRDGHVYCLRPLGAERLTAASLMRTKPTPGPATKPAPKPTPAGVP